MKFNSATSIVIAMITLSSGVAGHGGKKYSHGHGGGDDKEYEGDYNYSDDDRKLKEVTTSFLREEHNACMKVEYDMHLVIDGFHFIGLATPVEDAECPNVIFHSLTTDKQGTMGKFSMIASPEVIASYNADDKHYLGNKPLENIISAYDTAPVGKDGAKFYDSITNNCVSLLRNMADPLDVDINDEMIGFVSKKLLSHNENSLWEGINKSSGLSMLMKGGQRMLKGFNKEEMLSKLIMLYV